MPTLDGSSPAAVFDTVASQNALTTASFTPPSGSIIVAKAMAADAQITSLTPTGSGLTFTSRVNGGTASTSGRIGIYTAVGAGTTTSVTATFGGSTNQYRALVVEVWTAAQLAATPATNLTVRTTNPSAPSATITTTGTGSVVTWCDIDYIGATGTPAYRSSATQIAALIGGATGDNYYAAYQAAAAAGSQTYGMTAPSQNWVLGALEIQAGSAAVVVPRRRFVGQAVNRSTNF